MGLLVMLYALLLPAALHLTNFPFPSREWPPVPALTFITMEELANTFVHCA